MFARPASAAARSAFTSGARFASTRAAAPAAPAPSSAMGRRAAVFLAGVAGAAYIATQSEKLHLDSRGDYGARLGKYGAESRGETYIGKREKWYERIANPKEKPAASTEEEFAPAFSSTPPKRAAWDTRLGLVPDGTIVIQQETSTEYEGAEPEGIASEGAEPAGTESEDVDVTGLVQEVESIIASTEEPVAFVAEVGEVNWESPLLAAKLSGPCAENFKAAFSCFATSTAEPRGDDCLDAFKATQKCLLHDAAVDAANEAEED